MSNHVYAPLASTGYPVKTISVEILLINPFLTVLPDDPSAIHLSLGLGYLAAYLEKAKVGVAILDIAAEGADQITTVGKKTRYGLSEREIIRRIRRWAPSMVGITCSSTLHAKDAHETARIVKKADKNILVVMGGAHPSAVAGEVLADENVDLVVHGEGEITLGEIVRAFRSGGDFSGVLGVSWRQGRKIITNPPRPRLTDIDKLPFPARHLLPMNVYLARAALGGNYNRRSRALTMITSRGCPGNCVYCSVRTVWGRLWRGRSPANVVDEIESLVRDYQANEIHFIDDSLSVDRDRLVGICEEIIKRDLDISWTTPNGIAVWLLDKKLLTKMRAAGCYRLTFGLESGSDEILRDFIGKHYDHQAAREMISFASRLGLWTVGTFIIGFPYETREQIEETIVFANSTDLDMAVFYIANPFPGTPLYKIYQQEGWLPKGGAYEVVRGCRTKYFTHDQLTKLQAEAFHRFMKSRLKKPWRFFSKLRSAEDLAYAAKLARSLGRSLINQVGVREKGIASLWQ